MVKADFVPSGFGTDISHVCTVSISGNYNIQPTVIVHVKKSHRPVA